VISAAAECGVKKVIALGTDKAVNLIYSVAVCRCAVLFTRCLNPWVPLFLAPLCIYGSGPHCGEGTRPFGSLVFCGGFYGVRALLHRSEERLNDRSIWFSIRVWNNFRNSWIVGVI